MAGFSYNYKPIDYATASKQANGQLDPLYQRAVKGVQQQKYANDVQAGQVAAARGLGHSGLAADQLNKIAIAAQGNIADLNAQKMSQAAQMARDMVNQDKQYNLQNRAQLYSEYNNNRSYNYQLGRDKVGDKQWQNQFDFNKSIDSRNFNYQKDQSQADQAWRKYTYNNMSAGDKAQLDWAKTQYGEDAAWRMYELQYNGTLQKSISDAQLANFQADPGGGGKGPDVKIPDATDNYNNYWKTQNSAAKAPGFESFMGNLNSAMKSKKVPTTWAKALIEIAGRESTWNPNASNGTHFGYGQFTSGNMKTYSKYGNYNNPADQVVMMYHYMKDRYGSPGAALAFWDKHNWY